MRSRAQAPANEHGRHSAAGIAAADVNIYDLIREGILSGRYPPGGRLIEARLAEEFGVSRTRIRDALARLQSEHLVSPAQNRGVVVRQLTARDIEEISMLRMLLEGHAARTAAGSITTPELDKLAELNERMAQVERAGAASTGEERLAMIRTVTDLNNSFHRAIQTASRNVRLETILRSIVSVPLVFQSFYWYSDRELAESLKEHQTILDALRERDGALAESLMQRHITRGLNTLLREVKRP